MRISNQEQYDEWIEKNTDPYGKTCVQFAIQWAEEMEKRMERGESLEDMYRDASHEVDHRPGFGITGFMYGAAVSVLATCWEHGDELRKLHNLETQVDTEGEEANKEEGAVLNPAVLVIGKKKE